MSEQQIRVYSDGVFDGFHRGHARQLRQAKNLFPNVHLVVGVCGQEDVEQHKGPTIFSGAERKEMIEHCKYANEVIYPAPWIIDERFLEEQKIDFVAHDDLPYVTAGVEDAYATCKRLGKFKGTQRTEGISTTDMITKIIRNREDYILRNIRRGLSRSELGVGFFELLWIKLKQCSCRRNN